MEKDTIEEVVVELKNCINLTKEEVEIVKKELTMFLADSPMIQTLSKTHPYSHSQTQLYNISNTICSINKSAQLEVVKESYNQSVNKLKKLLESKEAIKLNQLLAQYKDIFHSKTNTCSPNSILKSSLGDIMNEHNKQLTIINKVINNK